MLIVSPTCATSYGVDKASLRPIAGRLREVRCHRCRFIWPAELSDTDKLIDCQCGAPSRLLRWPLPPRRLQPRRADTPAHGQVSKL